MPRKSMAEVQAEIDAAGGVIPDARLEAQVETEAELAVEFKKQIFELALLFYARHGSKAEDAPMVGSLGAACEFFKRFRDMPFEDFFVLCRTVWEDT